MTTMPFPLVFALTVASAQLLSALAQPDAVDQVLVQGNPPLTQLMVGKTVVLLDWALELALTPEQEGQIGQVIIRAWQQNDLGEIGGILGLVELYDEIAQLGEEDREHARAGLHELLVQSLHAEPEDDLSQVLLSAYAQAHSTDPDRVVPPRPSPASPVTLERRDDLAMLSGIYRMVRPRMAGVGVVVEYITFFPDGHVYWALPAGGLLYFDPEVAQQNRPNDWGTYEIKDGDIHILRGPEHKLYMMTKSGERLNNPATLGQGSFRPVPPFDGLRLDGSYRRGNNPAITLSPNGAFRDEGAFLYSSYQRLDGTEYHDDGVGGSGTYLIAQNTLELRYSDGRIKWFSFIAFPENIKDQPLVDSFILNWDERWERDRQ